VIDSTLFVVDQETFARSKIGPITLLGVRGLATTSDGRLFVLSDNGGTGATISSVSPTDASLAASWSVPAPVPELFAGGGVSNGSFELVFGTTSFRFDPSTGLLTDGAPMSTVETAFVAIGSSSCSQLSK
jgi:hypothetical protein